MGLTIINARQEIKLHQKFHVLKGGFKVKDTFLSKRLFVHLSFKMRAMQYLKTKLTQLSAKVRLAACSFSLTSIRGSSIPIEENFFAEMAKN